MSCRETAYWTCFGYGKRKGGSQRFQKSDERPFVSSGKVQAELGVADLDSSALTNDVIRKRADTVPIVQVSGLCGECTAFLRTTRETRKE